MSDLSSLIITHETGTVIYQVHGFACIVTRDPRQLEEVLAKKEAEEDVIIQKVKSPTRATLLARDPAFLDPVRGLKRTSSA